MRLCKPILTKIIAILLTIGFLSCNKEKKLTDMLAGRWDITEATLNGNKNDMLDNLYLDFRSNDSLRSNIMNDPKEADFYEIKDKTIHYYHPLRQFDFKIQAISDSTLSLNLQLDEQKLFQLEFVKAD